MSENFASEIGATDCLTTRCRIGAGGGSGGGRETGARPPVGQGLDGVVVMLPKGRVSKLTA